MPAVILGLVLGAPVGLALDAVLGYEMVVLGAVNAVGWFGLGLASGRWGSRVRGMQALLAGIGVAGFSSWAPLILNGPESTGAILIAFVEVAFGFLFAVLGHLVTMPRGRDL